MRDVEFRAALWQKGSAIDLGNLGGSFVQDECAGGPGSGAAAHGINELGQIVGTSDTLFGGRQGFIWEKGVMRDLVTWAVPVVMQRPSMISVWSWAIAKPRTEQCTPSFGFTHVLWENGRMKLLSDLGVHDLDGDSSGAIGINDSGEILVNTTKDGQHYKAFLVKLK